MADPFRIDMLSVELESPNRRFMLGGGLSSGISIANNTTRYLGLGQGSEVNATESTKRGEMNILGTASSAWVYVKTAQSALFDSTMTLRKNGVDTTVVMSLPGGSTGAFQDATHSVDFVATDELDFKLVVADDTELALPLVITHWSLLVQGDPVSVVILGGAILGGVIL